MGKKRIPCPYCSEKILPTAKKCRFCGEKLDGKNQNLPISKLYLLWLTSLIIFFVSLFVIRRTPDQFSMNGLLWLTMVVIFGGISYLALMIDILRGIKSRTARKFGFFSVLTFISFFLLLFNIENVEAKLGLSPISKTQPQTQNVSPAPAPSVSPTPTPVPTKQNTNAQNTNSNKITCTGPDGKEFVTTQQECDDFNTAWGNAPTPDPNEIIRCNIHPNCGGGYKEMTRASCDQMICCEVDFDHTVKFTSKDQCHREQEDNADKAWSETCDALCGAYDTSICNNYYQPGTIGMSECISDQLSEKSACYDRCYSE